LFQGFGRRRDLRHHIAALAALVEHALDPFDLSCDTMEAFAEVLDNVF
jgi:hypothetical protein